MRMISLTALAVALAMPAIGQVAESEAGTADLNAKALVDVSPERATAEVADPGHIQKLTADEMNALINKARNGEADIVLTEAANLRKVEDKIAAVEDALANADASIGESITEDIDVEVEAPAVAGTPLVKKAVIRKRVIMRDADGNEDVKETTEVIEGAAVDALDIEALTEGEMGMAPKPSIAIVSLNNGVTVDAGGASVIETLSDDGETRTIRIQPEDGGKATVITIKTE